MVAFFVLKRKEKLWQITMQTRLSMPQFNDFEIDLNKKEVAMMSHLSLTKQAEGIINRLEFVKTAFSDEERNLIVNYAYKLNDMEKTRELAEHIYYEETEGNQGASLAVIDAQAAIANK